MNFTKFIERVILPALMQAESLKNQRSRNQKVQQCQFRWSFSRYQISDLWLHIDSDSLLLKKEIPDQLSVF